MARYNVDLQDNEGNAYQIMANPDSVAEFSPAANRENIRSGETYRVIFGKIMKYLSEVGNAAYVGLANNCTTTIAGFALDARQGKELMDRINELNRDLGGLSFGQDADGNWGYKIGGADTVTPFNHFSVLEVPLESNEFSLSLNFAPKFIAVHVTNVSQKILGYSGFTVKNGVSSGITAAGSILNMDVNFEGNKISVHVPIFVRESGHKYTVVIC